ncbi:MAG: hypothetical protein AB7G75_21365 [Candidatus Binatia bacterium]
MYRLKSELIIRGGRPRAESSERAKGEPRSQRVISNPQVEAERWFLKAIEIARQQHAKALEPRVAVSLARLWQQQNKIPQAQAILSEIYGRCTDEIYTPELQRAKALFGALREQETLLSHTENSCKEPTPLSRGKIAKFRSRKR